ncbi:MAG: peptidylprolyl isomerase [Cryomorphaceae bacterium]|nr:peptidylprolyl isomerase [Cryomorphaceae bacterium]
MSVAKSGDAVKVHYTGTLNDGSIFDSSEGKDPLEFTLGQGQMIPGFEQAVLGMSVGDKKEGVNIPSAEAYGDPSDEMVIEVPKENVPAEINPEVGQQLAVTRPDGQPMPVIVKEVKDEAIVLDANHPLAGKDLNFAIELVSIG